MKIENHTTYKLKLNLEEVVQKTFAALPRNHTLGITRVVFVDRIQDRNIPADKRDKLPLLYHPKTPVSGAWFEIALAPLLEHEGWWRRLVARRTLHANLTHTLLALMGQHYHFNFSHGKKKTDYEPAIRDYIRKGLEALREQDTSFRMRLMRPLIPYLDRFARWLAKQQRKALQAKAKQAK
ncbi:hypothetical protein [Chloracidobacterium thermophilum]|jgi:hypothetical protein|uniref:Uncharacterized protein n=1 Tax=Chloracidobacterium thermophilum (strain B) TaxID=981222 RepID=G2LEN7_CHLTF|nr:hypothetical protein [Chloracidobacterium thermophilum]AEP12020.1 hypothetical protein Cabther_A1267 [Chloracidobacterium thermophilum B]QUV77772.1 hypothetical protein J8C08_06415 [Chloracidobacterium thermophilum]